ncbi:hypothetical protein [Streptomyces flaveolus]|uniref:hypothetical protein n=1 Tax=Streptomyces flaveolus TaxID=67297 RepID=UPI0036BABCA7
MSCFEVATDQVTAREPQRAHPHEQLTKMPDVFTAPLEGLFGHPSCRTRHAFKGAVFGGGTVTFQSASSGSGTVDFGNATFSGTALTWGSVPAPPPGA